MAKEGSKSFGGSEAKCVGIGEVKKKNASVEYQRDGSSGQVNQYSQTLKYVEENQHGNQIDNEIEKKNLEEGKERSGMGEERERARP